MKKIKIPIKPLIGVYPGTFDPVTLGHLDIIERAMKVVDHLVIGVADSESKGPLFPVKARVAMMKVDAFEPSRRVRDRTARIGFEIVAIELLRLDAWIFIV